MPRYKLSVPENGATLYGDDTAIVADTIEEARDYWEDWDGEPAIYLHSYVGVCRIVYKRDVDNGDCHEDAEPGDTTLDYVDDTGQDLGPNEVRVWMRGAPHLCHWRMEPLPREPVHPREIPVGCSVYHPVLGSGRTVARALHRRGVWRLPVRFARPPHSPRFGVEVNVFAVHIHGTHGRNGWPGPPKYRLTIGDEHVADGDQERLRDLADIRSTRLRNEWEAEQARAFFAQAEVA